MEKKNYVAKLH